MSVIEEPRVVSNHDQNPKLKDSIRRAKRFEREPNRRVEIKEPLVVPAPQTAFMKEPTIEVPGLVYRTNFITSQEEQALIDLIDAAPWNTELQRRVQHYGWRYDYRHRRLDKSMRLGPLPPWAQRLGRKLIKDGLLTTLPDQVIVNEYIGTQGISKHLDRVDAFQEEVAAVSLLQTWTMVFRKSGSQVMVEKPLERRSVAVLKGDARYKWTHEIPAKMFERSKDRSGNDMRMRRSRRVSLTFRKVRT